MGNWLDVELNQSRAKKRLGNILNAPLSFIPKAKKKKKKTKHPCKALECLICSLRFSLDDVFDGRYHIETFVCSFCYSEMQQKPHEQSCFGKPSTANNPQELGYDPNSNECQNICPDHSLCQQIVRPDLAGLTGIVLPKENSK